MSSLETKQKLVIEFNESKAQVRKLLGNATKTFSERNRSLELKVLEYTREVNEMNARIATTRAHSARLRAEITETESQILDLCRASTNDIAKYMKVADLYRDAELLHSEASRRKAATTERLNRILREHQNARAFQEIHDSHCVLECHKLNQYLGLYLRPLDDTTLRYEFTGIDPDDSDRVFLADFDLSMPSLQLLNTNPVLSNAVIQKINTSLKRSKSLAWLLKELRSEFLRLI